LVGTLVIDRSAVLVLLTCEIDNCFSATKFYI